MGVLGDFRSGLFSQNPCFKSTIILRFFFIFYVICILPRSVFCLPGLRRKSLNVSADVDATPGVPGLADFGILTILGRSLFGGPKTPLLVVYIGRVWGRGDAVTTRRGGGYRTLCPVPEAGAQHYRAGGERRRFSVTYSEFRLRPPKRPPKPE